MRGRSQWKLLLLPLLVGACLSRRTAPLAPSGTLPAQTAVVLKGGTKFIIDDGRFTPDSILGRTGGTERFAVSRDSVDYVEDHSTIGRRWAVAGLVAAGATVGAFLLLLLMLSGDDS